MKKSFTLAEIMIALTIIGVITAILLPVAQNSLPNEKVMKFKKANATLHRVINELVTSDKYFKGGDLGIKADGEINPKGTYIMAAFADLIETKSLIEMTYEKDVGSYATLGENQNVKIGIKNSLIKDCNMNYRVNINLEDLEVFKNKLDRDCKNRENYSEELTTTDNIEFFQSGNEGFGLGAWIVEDDDTNTICSKRFLAGPNDIPFIADSNGMDIIYKIFCIDIDGFNKGEDPFGYGIRADGKVMLGARAQEWLEKDIQDKE